MSVLSDQPQPAPEPPDPREWWARLLEDEPGRDRFAVDWSEVAEDRVLL